MCENQQIQTFMNSCVLEYRRIKFLVVLEYQSIEYFEGLEHWHTKYSSTHYLNVVNIAYSGLSRSTRTLQRISTKREKKWWFDVSDELAGKQDAHRNDLTTHLLYVSFFISSVRFFIRDLPEGVPDPRSCPHFGKLAPLSSFLPCSLLEHRGRHFTTLSHTAEEEHPSVSRENSGTRAPRVAEEWTGDGGCCVWVRDSSGFSSRRAACRPDDGGEEPCWPRRPRRRFLLYPLFLQSQGLKFLALARSRLTYLTHLKNSPTSRRNNPL